VDLSIHNANFLTIPALQNVTSLKILDGTFTSLDVPLLQSIGNGGFTIANFLRLNEVNAGSLATVEGSLQLIGNLELVNIAQFGILETLNGNVNISGRLSTYALCDSHR
jgi:filamentous hemagglutinin family protein